MAAVTVTKYRTNVVGSYRQNYYTINVAASGDTLDVKMREVVGVSGLQADLTGALLTPIPSGTRISLGLTGASVTGLQIGVTGR